MQCCLCVVRKGYYSNVLLIYCGLNKNAKRISRQVEYLPCRKKQPPVFFLLLIQASNAFHVIQMGLLGTRCYQSEFDAHDTFLVKVNRGCTV